MVEREGKELNPRRESQQEYFGLTEKRDAYARGLVGAAGAENDLGIGIRERQESLLEAFARDPAVQEILRAKTRPSGERRGEEALPELEKRRSYALSEDLLPAGEELPPAKIQALSKPSGETLSSYSAALFAISGALSLVHSLLHGEQMRTPVGGRAWETLGALSEEVGEISDAVRAEMGRCSGGEGFVE